MKMKQVDNHTQAISHLQVTIPSHKAKAAQLTSKDTGETQRLLGLVNDLIKHLPSPAVPQRQCLDKHTLQLH